MRGKPMLVLLDRDGVINEDLYPGVLSPADFRFIPGSLDALRRMQEAGWNVAVVTNQSAIEKGLTTAAIVDEVHAIIDDALVAAGGKPIRYYVCPDHPDRPTERRKPKPGMLREALADFGALAEDTPLVGDARRDLEAAAALGCPRYLVRTGQGPVTLSGDLSPLDPVTVCDDLSDAVDRLLARYA